MDFDCGKETDVYKRQVVDPHLSDPAVGVANQWLPIRPGTDSALVAGMIHYLFTQGKLDEALIREKFVGFFSDSFVEDVKLAEPADVAFMGMDKSGALAITEDLSYEAYLKGTGGYEGTGEKTPEWAASITGIPADSIRALADLYLDGPTATIQGWGPQRHSNGGNSSRAIAMIDVYKRHATCRASRRAFRRSRPTRASSSRRKPR